MMQRRTFYYRWDMTPGERAALLHVLGDYIARPDATEVSIDAATGAEIQISDLLAILLQITPSMPEDRNG